MEERCKYLEEKGQLRSSDLSSERSNNIAVAGR